MFENGKQIYRSDIILGERYRHVHTGIEGRAEAIYFFTNACERVTLHYVHDGELKEVTFDAPDLELVATRERVATERPGGPARESGVRPVPA